MTTYRSDMSSAPGSVPVRLRLTWSQRRAFVLTVVGFQALVWGDFLLNAGRFGGGPQTALAGLALMVMAAATWWVGTSLTHRGVVIHAFPWTLIPWDEVHEIEVESQLGISTVVVHHGKGTARRTRLAAPTTGPLGYDGEFQDKVRVMRGYWAAHRDRTAEASAA